MVSFSLLQKSVGYDDFNESLCVKEIVHGESVRIVLMATTRACVCVECVPIKIAFLVPKLQ